MACNAELGEEDRRSSVGDIGPTDGRDSGT